MEKQKFPKLKKGVYRHYKGNLYRLIAEAHHSETLEPIVVYQALYDTEDFGSQPFWVRPRGMWDEPVEWEGKTVPRFVWVKE